MFGVFKPISHKTVENKKNKYIKECNRINKIKIPEIRIHDFRHPYVKPTTKKLTTFFEDFRATA